MFLSKITKHSQFKAKRKNKYDEYNLDFETRVPCLIYKCYEECRSQKLNNANLLIINV